MGRLLKRQLPIVAFFTLLSALSLYWLLFHSATHVPGEAMTDYFHFHWSYWWIRHALTTPGLNVYQTNYVMFPNVVNMALHTWTPFWFPVWALLEPLIGTLQTFDVIYVAAVALTGYSFYLLLRHEGVPAGLALIGGAMLQLTPSITSAIIKSTLHYMGFFWMPITMLLWAQIGQYANTRWKGVFWSVVLGLAFFGMLLTDYQYAVYLALVVAPYGILTLVEAKDWQTRIRMILLGILAVALMLVLMWTIGPLRYLLAFDRSTLAPPPAEQVHTIPFPEGFFSRYDKETETIMMGAVAVPLTILTLIASLTVLRGKLPTSTTRRRWFWFALSVLPLMLAAGAVITVFGIQVPMPYKVVHELLGRIFRSPDRFGTVFLIPALLFCGLTWGPLLKGRFGWQLAVTAAMLVLVMWDAQVFKPLPIQLPLKHYDFYDQIGQERGKPYDDEVIVEVPNAAGSGESWVGTLDEVALQFYGMRHQKRMVNGLIARVPVIYYWSMRTDDPLLSWFGQRRLLDPKLVEAELRDHIFKWPIGYIIVHQDMVGLAGPTNQEIIGYLNTLPDLVCPYTVEGDAVVYRTAWHPDGCPTRTPQEVKAGEYQIDIGTPGDERFIGWGWHYKENVAGVTLRWTGEYPQTQVYVDLPKGGYQLSLSAQAFHQARKLQVLVNDKPVKAEDGGDSVTVPTEALTSFTFNVPASVIDSGKHITVTLKYDGTTVPADIGQGSDPRKLAIAVDWIRFTKSDQLSGNQLGGDIAQLFAH